MFTLKNNLGRYIVGALVGMVASAILYFVLPVQWKAQALVRIGQISHPQIQANNFVESLPTVVERLKSRSFVQAVSGRANRNDLVALLNLAEEGGMTFKPIANSDSFEISIVGGSSELVRIAAEAVVAELVSQHDTILNKYQEDIKQQLQLLDGEVDTLSNRITKAAGEMKARGFTSAEARGELAGSSILTDQRVLEVKLNQDLSLKNFIASLHVRPTSLLEPVSISERRILFSLWRACLLGALSGMLLSTIWARCGRSDG